MYITGCLCTGPDEYRELLSELTLDTIDDDVEGAMRGLIATAGGRLLDAVPIRDITDLCTPDVP